MPAIVNVLSNILKLLFTSPSVQRLCPRNCNWPPVHVGVLSYPSTLSHTGMPCGTWEYPMSKCSGIPEYLDPSWDALWWGYPMSKCPGIPKYLISSWDPHVVGYPMSKCPGIPKYPLLYWDPLWWDTPHLSVPGFPSTLSHTGIPCGGVPNI